MKKFIGLAILTFALSLGCQYQPSVRDIQAQKAQQAANSVQFLGNAEIDNIKRRLELTSNPGQMGYVLLLNEMGQPILYTTVKGKITSSGKRLTHKDGCGVNDREDCPSDEGSYGSSDPYIYFWTMDGQYIQWNSGYLYSDKPLRIEQKPLVIDLAPVK